MGVVGVALLETLEKSTAGADMDISERACLEKAEGRRGE